jgi:hypothetical protein
MRLTEFADPKIYSLPADDIADFVNQLRRSSPDRPADDLASSMRPNRRRPPVKPRKLLDEL